MLLLIVVYYSIRIGNGVLHRGGCDLLLSSLDVSMQWSRLYVLVRPPLILSFS